MRSNHRRRCFEPLDGLCHLDQATKHAPGQVNYDVAGESCAMLFVMRSCHPSSTITRKLINKKRLRLLLAWKLKLAARGAWSWLIDQKAWNLAIFIRDKKHESNAHVHARQRVRCPCALRDSRPPRQARVKAGRLPLPRSTSLRRPRYRNSFIQGGLSHPLGNILGARDTVTDQ